MIQTRPAAGDDPKGSGARPQVFDRRLLRLRRERVASAGDGADFLVREVALRLAERLADVRRHFDLGLDLSCRGGQLAEALAASGGVDRLVHCDLAEAMVRRVGGLGVVADEEALPFGSDRFDLVVSGFALHWVGDLPGTLAQIRHALAPDGLFLAAMAGGATLVELREALLRAELEVTGGAGARVSPFVDLRDAGMLLQRAGFALPMADVETIRVTYDHPLRLMRELGAMGEGNALIERRPLARATLARACEIYGELFADPGGRVPASFQIVFLTGWKPDPSQPRPLRRGSGRVGLAEALRVPDQPPRRS